MKAPIDAKFLIEILEMIMRKVNAEAPFGLLFAATAALISPSHEVVTGRPLYRVVPPLQVGSSITKAMGKLFGLIGSWQQRAAERRRLGDLDDHMLRDIGLERREAEEECRKPFWRP